jgi:hypothetical protein
VIQVLALIAALLPQEAADVRSMIAAQADWTRLERHVRRTGGFDVRTLRLAVDAAHDGDLAIRSRLIRDSRSKARNGYLDDWIARAEAFKRAFPGDAVVQDLAGMALWRLQAVDRDLLYADPYPHPALSPSGRYPLFGPHGDYPAMMADHFQSLAYFRDAVWLDARRLTGADDKGALIEYTEWSDRTYEAIALLADLTGEDRPRACRVQEAFNLLALRQQDRYHGYVFDRFTDSWRFNGRSWHHATCFDSCGGCRP